jgi:hypothetical protein
MALFAGKVFSATLHFDRDNVERRVVVKTARLRIHINAMHSLRDLMPIHL